MNPRRALFAVLLLPVLMANKCGKTPDDDRVDPNATRLPSPSVKLQVAGIDPAFASANHEFRADVFGNAFQDGARVNLSGTAVPTEFKDDATLTVRVPALPVGTYDVTVANPDGGKATLRKGLTLTESIGMSCSPVTVRFDFDSAVLAPDTRSTLESAASCLKDSRVEVRVEGHTDEQGTTEYNIALGQRRAESVQRYLAGLGVSSARMRSVSYGEERPVDSGGDPAAFSRNRRVEIIPREGM